MGVKQLINLEHDPSERVNLANNQEYYPRLVLWRERLIKDLIRRIYRWKKTDSRDETDKLFAAFAGNGFYISLRRWLSG